MSEIASMFTYFNLSLWCLSLFTLIFQGILLFKDGQRFTNRYGPDPKAVESTPSEPHSPPLVQSE